MNFDPALTSEAFLILMALLWLTVTAYSAFTVRWHIVREYPFTVHIFFATCIGLSLLAMMRTGVKPGLGIHLIGLTAATLMMGWRLALLAGAISQCLLVLTGYEAIIALGVNGLCQVIVPVTMSFWFCRLLQRLLPHNPFVFTIGAGFFGGALSLAAALVSSALLLYALGVYDWTLLWEKYLRFMLIAIYPEGFVNGVFISSMVAFHPRLISAFNPDSYFGEHP